MRTKQRRIRGSKPKYYWKSSSWYYVFKPDGGKSLGWFSILDLFFRMHQKDWILDTSTSYFVFFYCCWVSVNNKCFLSIVKNRCGAGVRSAVGCTCSETLMAGFCPWLSSRLLQAELGKKRRTNREPRLEGAHKGDAQERRYLPQQCSRCTQKCKVRNS